jgi:hypothetical protein
MTTITGITSGSPLIGSPIIVNVIAAEVAAVDTLAYHRIVVQVVAALEGVDTDYTTQQFYATIGDESLAGRTKQFDISSALQTVADKYEYTCNAATYPRIKFRIVAWEELMVNGVPSSGTETEYPGRSGQTLLYLFALQGAYSKADRRASNGYKKVREFSRKPSSAPQIVCVGETYAYTPAFNGTETTPATSPFTGYALDDLPCGPTSVVTTIATPGAQTIGGKSVYAMPKAMATRDRREFRFINSLGVLDSISVYSLAEVVAQSDSTMFSKAVYESFAGFARAFYRKHDGPEKLKMSSGAVDRHWQQWFAHEFCMAKHVWMFVPDEKANAANNIATTLSSESYGSWLPVHITTEETVSLIKTDGDEVLEVAFVVEMDDEGSTDSYLRV